MIVAMVTGVSTQADDAAIVANISPCRSPMQALAWQRRVFHVKQKQAPPRPC